MHVRFAILGGLSLGLCLLVGGLVAAPALAAGNTIYVTTTTDEYDSPANGICSLREAIQSVNTSSAFGGCPAGAPGDMIVVQGNATYTLSRTGANENVAALSNSAGDLDILQSMQITSGGSPATIQGGGGWADRVIEIHPAAPINVTLLGLIIQGGNSQAPGGAVYVDNARVAMTDITIQNSQTATAGGGLAILSLNGLVTMTNSLVMNNAAPNPGSVAGGIYNNGSMILINSAVVSNSALMGPGGGIFSEGLLRLRNVTVSGNMAADVGGGLYSDGLLLDLNNATVTANTTNGDGGGLFLTAPANNPRLSNTILAGNVDTTAAPNQYPDCAEDLGGTISVDSQGYNLFGDVLSSTTSNCLVTGPQTGDLTGSAGLGPLSNHGGATLTHALLPGSAAIDAGNPAAPTGSSFTCEVNDQRGYVRTAPCDIGAYDGGALRQLFVAAILK